MSNVLLTCKGSLQSNTWEWTPVGKVDLALDYLSYFPKTSSRLHCSCGSRSHVLSPVLMRNRTITKRKMNIGVFAGNQFQRGCRPEPLQRLSPYLSPPFMSYLFKGSGIYSSDSPSVFLGTISCKMLFENKKNVLQKFVKCCLV